MTAQQKQLVAEAAKAIEAADAAEAGAAFHEANPEIDLVRVWWHADLLYGQNRFHQLWAFYHAFVCARQQRDEYQREKREGK